MALSSYSEVPVTQDSSSSKSCILRVDNQRGRHSILKSSRVDKQYISTDEDCWVCLPVPVLPLSPKQILLSSSSDDCSDESAQPQKSVSFDKVHLRFYDQTLGDHPSTSEGPPITLDWSYIDDGVYDLENYEWDHKRCSPYVRRLSELTRRLILVRYYGFELAELRRATRAIRRKNFLPKIERKMERAIERIGHTTRNILRI